MTPLWKGLCITLSILLYTERLEEHGHRGNCVHLDAEKFVFICTNVIPELRMSKPKAGLWID